MSIPNIKMTGQDRYELSHRGKRMVLERSTRGWRMTVTSPVTQVYSLGGSSTKEFDNLMQVEEHYKSWRGLSALLAEEISSQH